MKEVVQGRAVPEPESPCPVLLLHLKLILGYFCDPVELSFRFEKHTGFSAVRAQQRWWPFDGIRGGEHSDGDGGDAVNVALIFFCLCLIFFSPRLFLLLSLYLLQKENLGFGLSRGIQISDFRFVIHIFRTDRLELEEDSVKFQIFFFLI